MPIPISLSEFVFGCPIAPCPSTFPAPPSLPINLITPKKPITITAPPYTDLWKKPGLAKASKFPFFHTALDLVDFHSASVTFNASWITLYDQGGIAILFPPEHHRDDRPRPEEDHPSRWIKAGVEYVDDAPRFSVVVANKGSWADWTLVGDLESKEPEHEGDKLKYESVTLEMVREGPSLLINIVRGEKKSTVREITWVFEKGLLKENPEVKVGAYVAKPTPEKKSDKIGIPVAFTAVEVLKRVEGDEDEEEDTGLGFE